MKIYYPTSIEITRIHQSLRSSKTHMIYWHVHVHLAHHARVLSEWIIPIHVPVLLHLVFVVHIEIYVHIHYIHVDVVELAKIVTAVSQCFRIEHIHRVDCWKLLWHVSRTIVHHTIEHLNWTLSTHVQLILISARVSFQHFSRDLLLFEVIIGLIELVVGVVGVAMRNLLGNIFFLISKSILSLKDEVTEGVLAETVSMAFCFDMLNLLFKFYL